VTVYTTPAYREVSYDHFTTVYVTQNEMSSSYDNRN